MPKRFILALFTLVTLSNANLQAQYISWGGGTGDCGAGNCGTGDCGTGHGYAPGDAPYSHLGAGCTTGFCNCGAKHPTIKFYTDVLILDRNGPRPQDFMVGSSSNVVMNHADLNFPVRAGGRFGFIFYDECGWDLEFNYFGLDQFERALNRTDPTALNFVFFGGVPAAPAASYDVYYASELHSGEFNVRNRFTENITFIAGIRGLELDETFNITEAANTGFFSSTDNELWGFQLGADVLVWSSSCLRLSVAGKAGIYHNEMDINAVAQNVQVAIDDDKAAFVADGSVDLTIPMGPCFAIRMGYQMLFMDGVALAPDQSTAYSIFNGSGLTDFGNPIYHGGYVGLQFVH